MELMTVIYVTAISLKKNPMQLHLLHVLAFVWLAASLNAVLYITNKTN